MMSARPTRFVLPLLATIIFFLAVGALAQTTNDWFDAVIQGRKLAQQLCEARPTENFTNTGVLKIKDGKGRRPEIPVKCVVVVTPTNWQNTYEAFFTNTTETLKIFHPVSQAHQLEGDYTFRHEYPTAGRPDADTTFAGSDFRVADLALEFFDWPYQKILPGSTSLKRGRAYTLLESTNPDPSTNGYSRVLTWIDKESGGILEAEAYDVDGRLLKEFAPKTFKKVNGQWELQEMEIRNVQTGSRTRLEFDLKPE